MPICNKRGTAGQALGYELRRKGLGRGHVNLTVVIDHACHILYLMNLPNGDSYIVLLFFLKDMAGMVND
ncbi:hypothetical protein NE675_12300, partial [Megasphaera massiliensis]|nr:hypothetical protein [Megasphaera massiliensis]